MCGARHSLGIPLAVLPRSTLLPPNSCAVVEVAVNRPSPKCQPSHVQLLSHYRDSLPPGSPLRDAYAQPAAAEGGLLPAAGLIVLGIVMLASGGILAGVAAVLGGGDWGYEIYKRSEAADAARAAWENRRIFLACTEQWTP
ncbi:hypothetical protein [Streptomyces althioticus]|uniref:hypothetical protein n=1 Tax=Streptomyces althioticus TaxID=83380 RepID=UPI0037A7FF3D